MTASSHPDQSSTIERILLQYIAEYHQGLNELAGRGTATEQAKAALEQTLLGMPELQDVKLDGGYMAPIENSVRARVRKAIHQTIYGKAA